MYRVLRVSEARDKKSKVFAIESKALKRGARKDSVLVRERLAKVHQSGRITE